MNREIKLVAIGKDDIIISKTLVGSEIRNIDSIISLLEQIDEDNINTLKPFLRDRLVDYKDIITARLAW